MCYFHNASIIESCHMREGSLWIAIKNVWQILGQDFEITAIVCLHSSGKLMLLNQTPNATFVFPYANTWFQILELIYRTFNFSLRIVRFNHVFCRIPILNWLHTCTASFWHLLTSFGIFWRLLVSFGVFFGVFLGFFCGVFRHLLFCPTGIRLHKTWRSL